MTVYFIGAGPGDPELITLKAQRYMQNCSVCIYAGSFITLEFVKTYSAKGAKLIDSARLNLDEIIEHIKLAWDQGKNVARLHSGDPSLYSAMYEQIQRLEALGIAYEIIPGVPAFCAAAAAFKQELTIPFVNQSVVLTRTAFHSTAMPDTENLANFAQSRATLVLHLSAKNASHIYAQIVPFYGKDCPVIIAVRIGFSDQKIFKTTLANIVEMLKKENITKTALIFIGQGLDEQQSKKHYKNSKLYSKNFFEFPE